MSELEDRVLKDLGQTDITVPSVLKKNLERAALVISGVGSEEEIREYRGKISFIESLMGEAESESSEDIVKKILGFFSGGYEENITLTESINSGARDENPILSLELLCILARRKDLSYEIYSGEEKYVVRFWRPTKWNYGSRSAGIYVDPSAGRLKDFNSEGRMSYRAMGLAADSLVKRAERKLERGEYNEAMEDLEKAKEVASWSEYCKRIKSVGGKIRRTPIEEKIEGLSGEIELSKAFKSMNIAELYLDRGIHFSDLEKWGEAINDYSAAIDLCVEESDKDLEAMVFFCRGAAKRMIDQFAESVKDHDEAERLGYQEECMFYDRALSKKGLKRYVEAIRDFDRAIELDGKYWDAYKGRADVMGSLAGKLNDNNFCDYEAFLKEMFPEVVSDDRKVLRYKIALLEFKVEDLRKCQELTTPYDSKPRLNVTIIMTRSLIDEYRRELNIDCQDNKT